MKISNIINNVSNKVSTYVNNKKEEIAKLDNIVNSSSSFTLDKEININNDNLVICNWYEYKEMCTYINLEFAKLIDGIIPLDETVINIVNTIEKISNNEYVIVFTNKRIIIMNKEKYTSVNYDSIINFSLVNKGFMTQVICFNNVILDMNIIYDDLITIYNLVTNSNFRDNLLKERINYLCGITPIYQKINKIKSGISIGTNNEIVFHNKKTDNYLCKYEDIANYELMEDNTVIIKKWTREQSHAMKNTKKECYKITIRVTLKNNQIFEIIILEPSVFNSSYYHTDKTYLEYFNFGKEIIDKLETYNEEKRKFS